MSYYYNLNDDQTEFIAEIVDYSFVNNDGNVETIQKKNNSKNQYVSFKSVIDKKLLRNIAKKNQNRNDDFYKEEINLDLIKIYCGPVVRFKIKFKNQKEISFLSQTNKVLTKAKDFIEIKNSISRNFAENKFERIDNTTKLKVRLNEFKKYSLNKDTLGLPLPPLPMPKRKIIEFIK